MRRRKSAHPPRKRLQVRSWLLAAIVVVGLSLAVLRPWAAYSPVRMLLALDPSRRAESFRSFDDLVPHGTIAPRQETTPFERAEAPMDAAYDWNGESKLVEAFLEEASVTGLLVLHEGVIVHERYRLGATVDSRHATFGLARGVVAALVAGAQNDGLIASLDDAAAVYAPQLAATEIGAASLKDLLAASSGLAGSVKDGAFGDDLGRLFLQTFLLGGDPDRIASRAVRARPAGEGLGVSAAETQALAAVVSAVYGAPLAEVVEQQIWRPYGMTAEASWSQSRDGARGVALGFCCLNATLQDLARFGEILRRDGAGGEERLLPEGWIEAAGRPSAPFAEPGAAGAAYGGWGYGLGVFIPDSESGELLLSGEYGQYLWIDRRRRTVIALTAADQGWLDRRGEATAALRRIAAAASE